MAVACYVRNINESSYRKQLADLFCFTMLHFTPEERKDMKYFTDEGDERVEFFKMMQDCYRGEIEYIVVCNRKIIAEKEEHYEAIERHLLNSKVAILGIREHYEFYFGGEVRDTRW